MNNYTVWCMHYNHILYPYYLEFIKLFEKKEQPSYPEFLSYCYKNTEKVNKSGILTAYLTPYV